MLSYSSDTGWMVDPIQCMLFVGFIGFTIYRSLMRRHTLRQREDGAYVWIEWHGGERCSATDPSAPGGEWESDGGGDGDGGGGGGD